MPVVNDHGQPVGDPLGSWAPPAFPPQVVMTGTTCVLEPLDWSRHGSELWDVFSTSSDDLWTYMPFGPFNASADLEETIGWMNRQMDWLSYAIRVDETALGFASYLRIQPADGVIEIGAITYSPPLQRTVAATEAIYLMIRNVFDLGYRRCEWKCDSLNEPSKRAGERFGFRYEGTFRKATHYKGRNRDTAWFAITDDDWAIVEPAYARWLSPGNFDPRGIQRNRLGDLIAGMPSDGRKP